MIEVADPAAALFASDMHLDDEQPALTERFLADLDARVAQAEAQGAGRPALFLLGDCFEFWIGDDAPGEAAGRLATRLAALAARGWPIFLMHGNRDFLIDAPLPPSAGTVTPWSRRCGATLLADPTVVSIGGRRVLLSHGDAFCTADARYQAWRALCRSPRWQAEALARPVAERRAMALTLRQQSRLSQQQGAQTPSLDTVGDVDPAAVDQAMTAHGVDLLVHGHTHRPALHRWRHAGRPRLRWVLPDWSVDAPARGRVLSLLEGLADSEGGTASA